MAFFGMNPGCGEVLPELAGRDKAGLATCGKEQDAHARSQFREIRPDDVVFIKQYVPQTGMDVTAVGVVMPGLPSEDSAGEHVRVQWVWNGKMHIANPEEDNPLRIDPVYEEFDIEVQRELIDLMPEVKQDPFYMVMHATS